MFDTPALTSVQVRGRLRAVAGVDDRLGTRVDDSWLDRRVVAHLGTVPSGYGEQGVTAIASLIPVPADLSSSDAVAMVGTGRTAQDILELKPPVKEDVVLVLSAAGGLGWLLVQASRAAGATVIAAAGDPERVAASPPLGRTWRRLPVPDWGEMVRSRTDGVTLVYDGVGGEVGRKALALLRAAGDVGFSAGEPTRFDTGDVVSRGITIGWSLGPRMQSLPGRIPGLASRALDAAVRESGIRL